MVRNRVEIRASGVILFALGVASKQGLDEVPYCSVPRSRGPGTGARIHDVSNLSKTVPAPAKTWLNSTSNTRYKLTG